MCWLESLICALKNIQQLCEVSFLSHYFKFKGYKSEDDFAMSNYNLNYLFIFTVRLF